MTEISGVDILRCVCVCVRSVRLHAHMRAHPRKTIETESNGKKEKGRERKDKKKGRKGGNPSVELTTIDPLASRSGVFRAPVAWTKKSVVEQINSETRVTPRARGRERAEERERERARAIVRNRG